MKIAAFGSTYAGAYVFPTYKAADDLTTERPSSLQRVGSTSGAFDFLGSTANPIMPLTVRKSFEIVASTYAGVETALNTARASLLAADESKLWALMRDGSKRWTYAKVTAFSAPESVGTRQTIPVSVEFACREGLWYGETANTQAIVGTTVYTVTNAGNATAPLKITAAISSVNMTSVRFDVDYGSIAPLYRVTYGGTVVPGTSLVIDSGAYSVTNNGAADYANLTVASTAGDYWLALKPGSSDLHISAITHPAGTRTVTAEWYDTWVM